MDRELARAMLHQVRKALHDVDPAQLYSAVSKPDHDEYDRLALAAMQVLTTGGDGAAATDAVATALQAQFGTKLGFMRKRLLRGRLRAIADGAPTDQIT